MPEMHLRQPGLTYNSCGPFTKTKEYENLKKQEIHDIFIKKKLDKACFRHNMVHDDFEDYSR